MDAATIRQAYIGEQGSQAQLARASNKKYAFAKKVGLATTPEQTEAELLMSLLLDLNASAHADLDGQWMTLVDTEETVHDLTRRRLPNDELGRLSSKVVDVPRFELGNRNAERIRCFILGFQVAERLAAWNNTRYGGGL